MHCECHFALHVGQGQAVGLPEERCPHCGTCWACCNCLWWTTGREPDELEEVPERTYWKGERVGRQYRCD